ncbi:MAG: VWA domain-containing protein [Pirellulales bacterium]|nr:VWA domain-containing protein [Pirellulales bacterium]
MSPSLLQKVKLGIRPRPPKPRPQKAAAQEKAPAVTRPIARENEEDEDEERVAWIRAALPGWLVSMLTHVIVLLALALLTLTPPEKPKDEGLVVSTTEPEMETEEILDDIELEPEETELEENFEPADIPDVTAVEVTAPGALGDAPEIESIDTSLAELPLPDAGEWEEFGEGETDVGKDGLGPPISFFGVKTKGRRFMFIVDNSNSMNKGRFEAAVAELQKSVNALSANQEFYIIFYSDTAYPLFYPQTAKTWVKATTQNKAKLQSWLSRVQRCLRTNGTEAFRLAMSMKPDVVYLLGDGAFGDRAKLIPSIMAIKDDKLVIHTLGFNLIKGREDFEAIARKFKGKFTDVKVTPAMAQLSQQLRRPKNNKQNGVWGIKLGQGKPPKKKKK